ncbi:hypothetical protein BJ508DRAFT_323014 [Ascobolus immersus RN42]|uniref:Uncharacterized protein n=1 Tax=Ascobolus immersus RN42 TaxID=1160509 RepID=A0A3N4IKH3_ASCIM|nr:hypothetical protein BJ508DRAFT_323014 [Ascobolus immersus RN42]
MKVDVQNVVVAVCITAGIGAATAGVPYGTPTSTGNAVINGALDAAQGLKSPELSSDGWGRVNPTNSGSDSAATSHIESLLSSSGQVKPTPSTGSFAESSSKDASGLARRDPAKSGKKGGESSGTTSSSSAQPTTGLAGAASSSGRNKREKGKWYKPKVGGEPGEWVECDSSDGDPECKQFMGEVQESEAQNSSGVSGHVSGRAKTALIVAAGGVAAGVGLFL